jgi:glutathione peroxidase
MSRQGTKFAYIGLGVVGACLALGAVVKGVAAQSRVTKPSPLAAKVPPNTQPAPQSATQFDGLMGGEIDLAAYRGKVILVVNTASQCGFTGQYAGLESLYQTRQRDGLVIVGVPSNDFGGQEPGSAGEIKKFCELNYGVSFPMTAKYVVTGARAHPFYRTALTRLGASAEPAWNFHKILVGKNGQPITAFPSGITPDAPELVRAINAALAMRTP